MVTASSPLISLPVDLFIYRLGFISGQAVKSLAMRIPVFIISSLSKHIISNQLSTVSVFSKADVSDNYLRLKILFQSSTLQH